MTLTREIIILAGIAILAAIGIYQALRLKSNNPGFGIIIICLAGFVAIVCVLEVHQQEQARQNWEKAGRMASTIIPLENSPAGLYSFIATYRDSSWNYLVSLRPVKITVVLTNDGRRDVLWVYTDQKVPMLVNIGPEPVSSRNGKSDGPFTGFEYITNGTIRTYNPFKEH